jgi:uncharacterized protein YacL
MVIGYGVMFGIFGVCAGLLLSVIVGLILNSGLLCLVAFVAATVFITKKGMELGEKNWQAQRASCDALAEACDADYPTPAE